MSMTLKDAQAMLRYRVPFNAGNLSAGISIHDGVRLYTVYSYGVAIAVASSINGEELNPVIIASAYNHSKTTSKHANIVRKAWGL